MIRTVIPVGLLQCNCVIFGDELSGEAIVIDPGDDIEKITAFLDAHALRVKAIVITHAHIDHIAGAHRLRSLTGAPVYMNSRDYELIQMLDVQAAWLGMKTPDRPPIDIDSGDGTVLKLAEAEFHVIETPGHTAGSQSLWIPGENTLIAGDTLFRGSIGRTDLPGGNSKQILSSIKTRLLTLPEETVVIPGHGPETTVGREKDTNLFLRNL